LSPVAPHDWETGCAMYEHPTVDILVCFDNIAGVAVLSEWELGLVVGVIHNLMWIWIFRSYRFLH